MVWFGILVIGLQANGKMVLGELLLWLAVHHIVEVNKIEVGQTDENILNIYARHKDNPQIKWKDSIKDVVGMDKPDKIGMDV